MASATSKLEFEKEAKCSPHKFYEKVKYTLHHLPTIFPECYKSADIIEGDGESVGSVRLWKYTLPGTAEVLDCKEKTEVIDDENMILAYNFYEGHHTDHYKSFLVTVKINPKDDGCSVKVSVEYDKRNEGATEPHLYMDLFALIIEKLESQLLSA